MGKVFITGGTGYVGSRLIDEVIKEGRQAVVLTRSADKAEQLRQRGVDAVVGDLLSDGPWQQAIQTCESIIHLASPPTWGKKVTKKVANTFGQGHYKMTVRLLDHVNPRMTKKIVYIAGTSYYGDTGADTLRDSDYKNEPKGWGPYIEASVNVLDRYMEKGLPIVTAFPAQIYGPDSWMPQLFIGPIYHKKPVYSLKGYEPYFSPIHVEDTARACLFLTEHGAASERYILCDNEPMTTTAFMKLIEKELQVEGKVRSIPRWLCQLLLGPVLTEYATAHTYFTNKRLKDIGFEYRYPTAKDGIPSVVRQWVSRQS
ncbi:NAD(P)-dependent oxidoreductase [Paenibacillus sp. PR3]|uniref:NAD(P)-dependent oxidoreductase n=1 Tax=Paenibacillus terricola TaxID=2763503 RepID=A0ABR8N304_9BACL|nr:NAD(P)-dependent oxidoreductase [Paenibacillus terricola]MBD3921916.1 NAD(P)-dependent oxidoreductase [Paenibacillus terricola]